MDAKSLGKRLKEMSAQAAPGQSVDVSISFFEGLPKEARADALRQFLKAASAQELPEAQLEL